MKILFAGGGTGGHFYPIIAVAEAVRAVAERERIVGLELYYMSDDPYNKELLERAELKYIEVKSGKMRTYFSVKNITDIGKTIVGVFNALGRLFVLYPDVVFGKGGYASFPAIAAARILRIPVVIHESDISPGRVNKWVAPYAAKIAISYPETLKYFTKKDRVALTGLPIRQEITHANIPEDPHETFHLEHDLPVILVLGGSLGSENINESLIDILPQLLENYQVIHQTGKDNFAWMEQRATTVLQKHEHTERYKPVPYMEMHALLQAAAVADLVISRAGSTIFEIAMWGKPSIIIPLSIARGDHQRENAYSYARTGAATVIEEQNLKPTLFFSIVDRLMKDPEERARMSSATSQFVHKDAAERIAEALLAIGLAHS
ncbi:MAG: UDP diphospho-muramoyl pentapeptide beta-N acetylglucosaminyl transferase [Candidatus Giovannonibacteria bacterium GW2011_GWA2_53_7]|uniref:UDP-N-acetylglucosamine--N-acetylmuramyl-(pentapeptide) pyrophosphoryl-undecaprenol N-acetylglucosamine transferase n=1 Tax=Candidatus Giovannonibacteria bacterium GW2011_GWA2_53_7 TaxID=1618650 RepID=A0A0G2AP60_9BACT|nr:MAG: UDP diphospho-muramoyl pentapeptide beta-N acetylglucosaminyl transferase [Candidatus Giovannonibacteria bacterium GW2011_GWA2_53_7]